MGVEFPNQNVRKSITKEENKNSTKSLARVKIFTKCDIPNYFETMQNYKTFAKQSKTLLFSELNLKYPFSHKFSLYAVSI